jgi:hypothetical protein
MQRSSDYHDRTNSKFYRERTKVSERTEESLERAPPALVRG